MAERLNAPVLKTGVALGVTVGSNPTPTACFGLKFLCFEVLRYFRKLSAFKRSGCHPVLPGKLIGISDP